MITLIDGNNFFRRRAENPGVGSIIRSVLTEMHSMQGHVMLIWDGVNARKRRRDIYPAYKETRNKPVDDFFDMQKRFKELAKLTKVTTIEVDGTEADDVIAALVTEMRGYDQSPNNYFIHSNDADLWQLGVPMARDAPKIASEWMRTYKAYVGDKSDNIPGVKGFGHGAWEKTDESMREAMRMIAAGYIDPTEVFFDNFAEVASKSTVEWLKNPDNLKQLRDFYKIVGFMEVSQVEIDQGTTVGANRWDLIENILKEHML